MSFDTLGPGGLDYLPCRYGASKILFRGPKRPLDAPYVAFFGGTTTYGKYIETPFCSLIEQDLGMTCVNFGCVNGGVDAYAADPVLREAAIEAQVTVIQVTSPRNMSNRFYKVHPRRNDRFVEASPLLRTIYREVDFAEFNFTNHMLQRLYLVSPERFHAVLDELRTAWLARMRLVLSQIPGKTILLWASDHPPADTALEIDADPAFVNRSMIVEIEPLVTQFVQVVASDRALQAGTDGMVFAEMDAAAAATMLGPTAHREIADALLPALENMT
ncbi:DUF6473 family protein [uncultured Tateyamaria sp.]|uniref:DUF6473 family protein n=1 Tax=Tateyamaria sp. 1078 TaxID=3417464 RepID=UPI002623C5A3|nr:DUF6473 family protein [uncultured Tateyamaria sp.]